MKKLIFLILISTLLLFSCDIGNTDNDKTEDEGEDATEEENDLVWDIDTDVYLITEDMGAWRNTFVDDFFDGTGGVTLVSSSDAKPKRPHEIVIGRSEREVSRLAYEFLDKELNGEDSEGYLVYIHDGSLAIAYSSEMSMKYSVNAFLEKCLTSKFVSGNGVYLMDIYSPDERAEENRQKMYEAQFASLKAELSALGIKNADSIIAELEIFYTLYGEDTLTWLARLYDGEVGGFYFSNTARDNEGFLPDLESTGFAFAITDKGGLFDDFGGLDAHGIPSFMVEPMTRWIRSMQSPEDGCFYHPQWKNLTLSQSRIGRDLDDAIYLLNRLNANPMYSIPGNNDFIPTGPDAAVSLTSRLSVGRVGAVSRLVSSKSSLTLPYYLSSLEAWREYLEAFNINGEGRSYPTGNTLCSIHRLVREADEQFEKNNPNLTEEEKAPYTRMALNFLNDTQIPEIGMWEYNNGSRKDDYDPTDGIGYNGTNGLMKISVAYGYFNTYLREKGLATVAMPNAYNALQSAVKVAKYKNTSGSETVCYVYNNWTCLNSTLNNIKQNDPENFAAASALVVENLDEMISASYDLLITHKMAGGGFCYYEESPCNTSQGAPVACSKVPEADVNATTVATTSTLGAMASTIRIATGALVSLKLWCADDYYLFMAALEGGASD